MNRIARRACAACLSLLLVACVLPNDAWSGRNSGGSLVVHAEPGLVYSTGYDYCEQSYVDPGRCVDTVTQVDEVPGGASILWILAAFPAGASPAVVVTQFGVESTIGPGAAVAHGPCGPVSFTIPHPEFPSSGTGIAVTYYPTVYRTLFPVYWLALEGTSGDTFATTVDPGLGTAVFVDEGRPAQSDEVYGFGLARWGSAGNNNCPLSIERRDASLGEIKAGYR